MTSNPRPARFSGMVRADDPVHAPRSDVDASIAPSYVMIPGGAKVPQYSPTVRGTAVEYDPRGNCDGNFISSKLFVPAGGVDIM